MKKKENLLTVIQARMGSSRLPNKSMLSLHGYPIVEWVFRRASEARLQDCLVFAIPHSKKDDPLFSFLKSLNANIFRGSEFDLIDRFYGVALKYQATQIVRITADCPFVSGAEIDHLIDFFRSGKHDYAYNHTPINNSYPDGIGAEIMSFDILERLSKEVQGSYDREHITTYIRSHPEIFKYGTFDPPDKRLQHPELRLDLDTPEDYEKLLKMKVKINMSAHEIVDAATTLYQNEATNTI
jgi:spore coat polysaccharide biosynthesis protein SpsF